MMEAIDFDQYLKKEGVKKEQLNEQAIRAITAYEGIKKLQEKHPKDEDFKKKVEVAQSKAKEWVDKSLKEVKSTTEERKTKAQSKRAKRSESMKVVSKTKDVKLNLEECRAAIREERKRKVESGEIKPPKKKTRTTLIQELCVRLLKLCPSDDPKDVEAAEKEIMAFARKLMKLYGLTKIQPIEKKVAEAAEKLKKTEEKEEKKSAKAAA